MTSATPSTSLGAIGGTAPAAHIILLYRREGQRTYHTVADEDALCELLLNLCEAELARKRGLDPALAFDTDREATSQGLVQYDAADLLNFMDVHLTEVVVLKYREDDGRYDPEGREWLKNRMYQNLLAAANSATAAKR